MLCIVSTSWRCERLYTKYEFLEQSGRFWNLATSQTPQDIIDRDNDKWARADEGQQKTLTSGSNYEEENSVLGSNHAVEKNIQ